MRGSADQQAAKRLIRLLEAPLDSGHWGARMGRGPASILNALGDIVPPGEGERTEPGSVRPAEVERVVAASPFPTEIATAFALNRLLSRRVRAAIWQRRLPIVLAGNCMSAVGTVSGIRREGVGVIWLDAHADFHTPETSRSGFADGMALAALTGGCWSGIAATVPGFRPVDPRNVLLIGARDLDSAEPDALAAAGVHWIRPEELGNRLLPAIRGLSARIRHLYLHIDLDVLDPSVGQANSYAAGGGLTLDQAREVVMLSRDHLRIAAAAFTAYDPAHDPDGAIARAAVELLHEMSG